MVKIKAPNKRLCFDGTKVERFIETYEMVASLDEATELDMAKQIRLFLANDDLLDVLETLDGFNPPDWPKLKAAMVAYWGKNWTAKGGVASAADYQVFRQSWEPIQSYLLSKAHIDSVEEIRNSYYQSFATSVQDEIRRKLIRDGTMLPTFKILKEAADAVMKEQTALTFEESKTSQPVISSPFQEGNSVMKKMGEAQRPQEVVSANKPAPSMDELSRLFEAFEQKIDQKLAAVPGKSHRIREDAHQWSVSTVTVKDTAPPDVSSFKKIRTTIWSSRKATVEPAADFKVGCGSLHPWYPPAVSSQSFSGAYQADPAGRKRHEDPKLYKAPSVPSSAAKRPIRRAPSPKPQEAQSMEEEPELFERGVGAEGTAEPSVGRPEVSPQAANKPPGPKVRFERDVARDYPNAVDGALKKIFDLPVPHMTVAELLALAPTVAEGVKKWVSRRRVEVGSEEIGILAEGDERRELAGDPNLYSCPLGYLSCLVGEDETPATPLIDSGSQLYLISDSMANKFNLSPRVNFLSAVYGINNQACELIGVAEDVPIRVGKTVDKTCHFWITRNDGPLILGRPFLMDVAATLSFNPQSGEKIIIPDANGRDIELSLCSTGSGRWEREFPGQGRKAVLTHVAQLPGESEDDRPFL
ncbi:hypothetical protein PTTG_02255 [Puccinia triticina 1-1 BBBD Race 1]|uniref:Uncharacterized protein n=1 Tax=Puccinia triticina (isolate 1-1 / race 1 (BBBD)) TaxID=630390 RepID=A0A180G332_PUCT1|nr:hypothetical protein PTTG_02255 [Puccinia triticina 1-1 BBBD Race 1]